MQKDQEQGEGQEESREGVKSEDREATIQAAQELRTKSTEMGGRFGTQRLKLPDDANLDEILGRQPKSSSEELPAKPK